MVGSQELSQTCIMAGLVVTRPVQQAGTKRGEKYVHALERLK